MSSEIEKKIGYKFKKKELLELALTHSSYANEKRDKSVKSNERIEFLGDAVLSIVTGSYLYRSYPNISEGELTKMRAVLVCEEALFGIARELGLGQYLKLGNGESNSGGRERPSILADAVEALLGAIYLDSGEKAAYKFAKMFVFRDNKERKQTDYKTRLQEIAQKNMEEIIKYTLVDESGPAHNRSFTVEVMLNSNVIGRGTGGSKKEAEQRAAQAALELMGI